MVLFALVLWFLVSVVVRLQIISGLLQQQARKASHGATFTTNETNTQHNNNHTDQHHPNWNAKISTQS